MNEQIARRAGRPAELDRELVRQTEDRGPHAEGDAEGKDRTQGRISLSRPRELYKAGMFSLLAAVQLAWLAAIVYGIVILMH
jgi:hypothetical protein